MMLLIVIYSSAFALLPTSLSPSTLVALHFSHALAWTLFHTFGLGLVLRAQSDSKFLVKHFMKNYHYPHENGGSGAIVEAFGNWKAIYNMSMCMTFRMFFPSLPLFPAADCLRQYLLWAWHGRHIRSTLVMNC